MKHAPVIAIDGPSGSGKGTVASRVAKRLGWALLDSGALYRLTALAALKRGIALDDVAALADVARRLDVSFGRDEDGHPRVLLDGVEVGSELRTETCGEAASRVAALPGVRAALLDRQHAFRRPPGLVADGRDMGTVVFPDAELKVFLDASREARAERRYKQLKEQGLSANLAALLDDLARRDERDCGRSVAPLRPATDAVTIDSTAMGIDEVVDTVMALAAQRGIVQAIRQD